MRVRAPTEICTQHTPLRALLLSSRRRHKHAAAHTGTGANPHHWWPSRSLIASHAAARLPCHPAPRSVLVLLLLLLVAAFLILLLLFLLLVVRSRRLVHSLFLLFFLGLRLLLRIRIPLAHLVLLVLLLGLVTARALGFNLIDHLLHRVQVFLGRLTRVVEAQPLLHLLLQLVTKFGCGDVGEVVDAGGDGALIGQVSRDAALILCGSAADEG
mmetsp:Transcript_29067/g.93704  ORF Transcript_29067/g.93704 Transcript_29067/m.93704 type:complete len:213 (+) Transcript_29067:171-809(+)